MLDALLSSALVFGASQFIFAAPSPTALSLENSGAVAMSSADLIRVVRSGKYDAYWLGPKSGYKYALIATRKGEVIVSYLPIGSDINRANQVRLTVKTYTDPSKVKAPICSRGDVTTANNGEVCTNPTTFNMDTMREETTAIRGTDIRVVINYVSVQTVATMVKNGSSLKRIG
ncbi:MAG: hypothetical protein Q8K86_06595 [Candidatus Nanopelagicaceae bacterium]|nr:hypothetical protein [Candidatus Nanopelagicaceae bacterium]